MSNFYLTLLFTIPTVHRRSINNFIKYVLLHTLPRSIAGNENVFQFLPRHRIQLFQCHVGMIGWFCLKVNSILAQFLQNLFCRSIPGVIGFRVQGGCRYISGVRGIVVAPLESIAATREYQPRELQSVEKIVETRVIVWQRASRKPHAVFVLRVSIRVDIVGVNDLWLVHI